MRIILRMLVVVYPALGTVSAWYLAVVMVLVILFVPLLLAALVIWLMGVNAECGFWFNGQSGSRMQGTPSRPRSLSPAATALAAMSSLVGVSR